MAKWNKTNLMEKRLNINGVYQGRPIISRDSKIDGGVYLGQGEREAIVVDYSKSPKLRELYEIAKGKSVEGGAINKKRILRAVYDSVKEAMPKQSDEAVNELIQKYNVEKDGKISLDVFLKEGVGVCRHDALACAVLLEQFKKKGIIRGKPSVDRNSNNRGGHAWCRYASDSGKVFILDVRQKYLGSLEDSLEKSKWNYQRPEDSQ